MPQHGREATDGTIVAQVLAGDRDAFAHLVVRYQSVVHSIALAQLHHFADAEDVVQETFVRAFQSLDKLHVPGKFGAWIVTIARNTANTVGKQRQRAAMQPLSEADEPVAETDPGRQELRDLVAAELAKLPEDQREVLTLHYFSGKTTAEIAALLAISRHAAKKRLERSRALLGEKLLLRVGENVAEDKLTTAKRVQRAMAAVAGVTASWESAEAAAAVTGAAGITAATASGAGFVVKAAIAAVVAAVVVVGGGLYTGHVPLPKWDRAGTDITRSDTVASSGDAAPAQDTRDKNGIDNAGAAPIAPTPGSTGTATGTVIDVDTNKPIPKVQLAWWRMPMEGRSPRRQGDVVFASLQAARPQRTELAMSIAPSMVTTDNQGRFTINGPPGTYSIRVHDPVWVDDDRGVTFEVHESHTTEGIIVPALVGGVVSGRVFDVETGIGVPGVAIHLRHSGIVLEGSGETITDSAGRYRFQGLREGNGDLTRDDVPPYSRPDRQDRKDVSIGPRETMANLDFPLERGVTVAGRVVDGAGNALPDVALKTWAGMEELKTLSAAG
ncbi:MAG: sigma-70 family RNA polymerase sigma factor, partial [Candidatus Hydrogenedentes bacterium]|nr:sigma-70 family RNA polymerase sigma factor [Candidatus Hydrogenedentota bacterium]